MEQHHGNCCFMDSPTSRVSIVINHQALLSALVFNRPGSSGTKFEHCGCCAVLQSGRLELFSLESLAAHAGGADTEVSSSLGTLEVPEDQVSDVGAAVHMHRCTVML
jgi:hypothetical protein